MERFANVPINENFTQEDGNGMVAAIRKVAVAFSGWAGADFIWPNFGSALDSRACTPYNNAGTVYHRAAWTPCACKLSTAGGAGCSFPLSRVTIK